MSLSSLLLFTIACELWGGRMPPIKILLAEDHEIVRKELIRAIQSVYAGRTVLDPGIAGKVVTRLTTGKRPHRNESRGEELTERELEVLRAVADGKSNK